MSPDEYAELQRETGIPVRRADGVWWQKVRPLFYRPLLPTRRLPILDSPTGLGHLSYVQHAVKPSQPSNSYLNLVVFGRAFEYDTKQLPRSARRKVSAAQRSQVTAARFEDPEQFVAQAYPVYLCFYRRTGYRYLDCRTDPVAFADWASGLFRSPKTMVLGAFRSGSLLSVEITCLVGRELIIKESINSCRALESHASDFMLDWQRARAADGGNVELINAGYLAKKPGINEFKLQRGAHTLALPAHLSLPPHVLRLLKRVQPTIYDRLRGLDEDRVAARVSSIGS